MKKYLNIWNVIKKLIFDREKTVLAFEYGLVLSEVAKEKNIEVTPELVAKAEAMLISEFESQNSVNLAINMIPNIMSVFELDLSK